MKRFKIYYLTLFLVLLSLGANAQEITVSGTVLNKSDQSTPVNGVTITFLNKGNNKQSTTKLTQTDRQGNFSIKIPAKSSVQFGSVGFESQVVEFTSDRKGVRIFLVEALNQLEETIVVGYTNKSLVNNTSAVTVVKTKDLVQTPVANVMDLLQGRVAGLNIQLNNGTPGMNGTYTVRGISDISVGGEGDDSYLNSSNPLFVIDGIPQEDPGDFNAAGLLSGSGVSPISMVPVEDIESIQVLKDAAATSQYGSKGAYGVIIITTKRGNSPKPIVAYNSSAKFSTPPKLRDVMVGMAERNSRIDQILRYDTSAYHGYWDLHANPILSDSLNPYYNNNTDWQSIFYRTTYNQSHNVNVSGGDSQFNYKVNGNYYQENGIVKNTGFSRYGMGMLMEYKPFEKFSIMAKAGATWGLSSKGSGNPLGQSGIAKASSASSLLPPPSLYTTSNDVLGALAIDDAGTTISYNGSVQTTYKLPFDIPWNTIFGYTYSTDQRKTFTPGLLIGNRSESGGNMESNNSNSYNLYLKSSMHKSAQINMFRVGLTLGAELNMKNNSANSKILGGLPNGIIGPIGSNPLRSGGENKLSLKDNTVSFTIAPEFGLSSKKGGSGDKYVFNPTINPELNSAYGSKAKLTINPGFGFKWNFSFEPFMKKLDFLSFGDIRTSWGRVTKYKANIYDIWGAYLLNPEGGTYNGEAFIPIDFSAMPNAELKPITSTSWNIGTDLFFLNRKLTLTADAYYRQVDNQLTDMPIADHNSFDKLRSTDVSLVNRGLEVALGVSPLKTQSDFFLNMNFVLAINSDILTKLPDGKRQIINSEATVVNKVGENALSNYLYVYKGVYARDEDVPVDPATGRRLRIGGENSESDLAYFKGGDPIWADLNGDYIIDERDLTIVGNSQPRMTGGFNLNLRYKALSIYTNCSFTLRRDIINKALADKLGYFTDPAGRNAIENGALPPIGAYNFWTPEHTVGVDYPNPFDYTRASIVAPFRANQTLFMEDGSYFKINGISLNYALGRRVKAWLGNIRNLSITASANNIYTFSKYSGINPENVNSLGMDVSGGYPNSRSYTVGVNASF
jgi:TonB-linked SusC/RagA family outer membrane protein